MIDADDDRHTCMFVFRREREKNNDKKTQKFQIIGFKWATSEKKCFKFFFIYMILKNELTRQNICFFFC